MTGATPRCPAPPPDSSAHRRGAASPLRARHARPRIEPSAALLVLLLLPVGCGARTGLLAGDPGDGADASGGDAAADVRETGDAGDLPGDGSTIDANVAASLNGLRWELPCTQSTGDPTVCQTLPLVSTSATMGGVPGSLYDVTLRLRGVVEISAYVGGTSSGYWQIGGAPPAGSTINVYGLDVSSPGSTYYVNQGISHRVVVAIDYLETVALAAQATVTLRADSRDSLELRNLGASGQPVVVAGVAPAPRAFDGQFVQMDVVSVVKQ